MTQTAELASKIATSTMVISAARLAELRADAAVRVDDGNVHGEVFTWGVVVTRTAPHSVGGHVLDIQLCELESYARATLAPFHAFYDSTRMVHILHIAAPTFDLLAPVRGDGPSHLRAENGTGILCGDYRRRYSTFRQMGIVGPNASACENCRAAAASA
jgi:hypothetical protein